MSVCPGHPLFCLFVVAKFPFDTSDTASEAPGRGGSAQLGLWHGRPRAAAGVSVRGVSSSHLVRFVHLEYTYIYIMYIYI